MIPSPSPDMPKRNSNPIEANLLRKLRLLELLEDAARIVRG